MKYHLAPTATRASRAFPSYLFVAFAALAFVVTMALDTYLP